MYRIRRERERERQRETERETDRERQRERQTERDRGETETETEGDKKRGVDNIVQSFKTAMSDTYRWSTSGRGKWITGPLHTPT